MSSGKFLLWLEFFVLFVVFPVAVIIPARKISPILFLFAAGLFSYAYLRKKGLIVYKNNGSKDNINGEYKRIFAIFFIFALSASAVTYFFLPDYFLSLPKNRPVLWTVIMLLYPLLSVLPQNFFYRGFLFDRYESLFGREKLMLLVGAASFSFGHILYLHPVTLLMTFGGGILFSYTYQKTGSLRAVFVEHALYGCFIFTIGLGKYFYHARIN